MASQSAKGTLFKATISASFTTIARMTSCDGPGITQEMIEDKTLDGGTAVGMFPSGYTTQQPLSGKINFDPAATTDKFVMASVKTPVTAGIACKVIYPDTSSELAFTGSFTKFMPHATPGQALTADFEVQPHGAITVPV